MTREEVSSPNRPQEQGAGAEAPRAPARRSRQGRENAEHRALLAGFLFDDTTRTATFYEQCPSPSTSPGKMVPGQQAGAVPPLALRVLDPGSACSACRRPRRMSRGSRREHLLGPVLAGPRGSARPPLGSTPGEPAARSSEIRGSPRYNVPARPGKFQGHDDVSQPRRWRGPAGLLHSRRRFSAPPPPPSGPGPPGRPAPAAPAAAQPPAAPTPQTDGTAISLEHQAGSWPWCLAAGGRARARCRAPPVVAPRPAAHHRPLTRQRPASQARRPRR